MDGQRLFSWEPEPQLDPAVRGDLIERWHDLRDTLLESIDAEDETAVGQLEQNLARAKEELNEATDDMDSGVWAGLKEVANTARPSNSIQGLALQAFRHFLEWAGPSIDLEVKLYDLLDVKFPGFAFFSEADRGILAEYEIDSETTTNSTALRNLLAIAQLPLETIRANRNDPSYLEQLLDDAEELLKEFFEDRWTQEQIAVKVAVDGAFLRVFVRDTRRGSSGWLGITDRSDGLKMFVALTTFWSPVLIRFHQSS